MTQITQMTQMALDIGLVSSPSFANFFAGLNQAVLHQEAVARGVQLTGEAADFMLNRFSRDLSSLMQLLDKLDVYALQTQRAITIPLIKAMLESE